MPTDGSLLGIGLAVHLEDNFTRESRKVQTEMGIMNKKFERAAKSIGGQMQEVGTSMLGVGTSMAVGLGMAAHSGAKFEHSLKKAQLAGEATDKQMESLSKQARKLAGETIFSTTEVAEGMEMLSKANLSVKEIHSSMKDVLTLSAGGDIGMDEAATTLVNMAQVFDKPAEQFGDIGSKIVKAANLGTVSVTELSEAFKYAQSSMVRANYTMEEGLAMTTALGQIGLSGSIGGTSLRSLLDFSQRAATKNPSKKIMDALHTLKLTPGDFRNAEGSLKGPIKLLETYKEALNTKGVNQVDISDALVDVTQIRGARATQMARLLDEVEIGAPIQKILSGVENTGEEYGRKIAEGITSTLLGEFQKFYGKLTSLAADITEAIKPALVAFMSVFKPVIDFIGFLASTTIGKKILQLASAVSIFLLAFGGITWIIGRMIRFKTIIISLTARLNKFKIAQASAMGVSRGPGGQMRSLGGSVVNQRTGKYYRKGQFVRSSDYDAHVNKHGSPGMVMWNQADKTRKAQYGMMGGVGQKMKRGAKRGAKFLGGARGARKVDFASQAMGKMGRTVGKPIMKGMGRVAGRLLGFLGGPVGMIVSMFLPEIISLLKYIYKGLDMHFFDDAADAPKGADKNIDKVTRAKLKKFNQGKISGKVTKDTTGNTHVVGDLIPQSVAEDPRKLTHYLQALKGLETAGKKGAGKLHDRIMQLLEKAHKNDQVSMLGNKNTEIQGDDWEWWNPFSGGEIDGEDLDVYKNRGSKPGDYKVYVRIFNDSGADTQVTSE